MSLLTSRYLFFGFSLVNFYVAISREVSNAELVFFVAQLVFTLFVRSMVWREEDFGETELNTSASNNLFVMFFGSVFKSTLKEKRFLQKHMRKHQRWSLVFLGLASFLILLSYFYFVYRYEQIGVSKVFILHFVCVTSILFASYIKYLNLSSLLLTSSILLGHLVFNFDWQTNLVLGVILLFAELAMSSYLFRRVKKGAFYVSWRSYKKFLLLSGKELLILVFLIFCGLSIVKMDFGSVAKSPEVKAATALQSKDSLVRKASSKILELMENFLDSKNTGNESAEEFTARRARPNPKQGMTEGRFAKEESSESSNQTSPNRQGPPPKTSRAALDRQSDRFNTNPSNGRGSPIQVNPSEDSTESKQQAAIKRLSGKLNLPENYTRSVMAKNELDPMDFERLLASQNLDSSDFQSLNQSLIAAANNNTVKNIHSANSPRGDGGTSQAAHGSSLALGRPTFGPGELQENRASLQKTAGDVSSKPAKQLSEQNMQRPDGEPILNPSQVNPQDSAPALKNTDLAELLKTNKSDPEFLEKLKQQMNDQKVHLSKDKYLAQLKGYKVNEKKLTVAGDPGAVENDITAKVVKHSQDQNVARVAHANSNSSDGGPDLSRDSRGSVESLGPKAQASAQSVASNLTPDDSLRGSREESKFSNDMSDKAVQEKNRQDKMEALEVLLERAFAALKFAGKILLTGGVLLFLYKLLASLREETERNLKKTAVISQRQLARKKTKLLALSSQGLDKDQELAYTYKNLLDFMESLDFAPKLHQGPSIYSKRLGEEYPEILAEAELITDTFNQMQFGKKQITEEQILGVRESVIKITNNF